MIFQRASFIRAGRIAIAFFLITQIVLGYVGQTTTVAHAQQSSNTQAVVDKDVQRPTYSGVEGSIEKYLCTPSEGSLGGALFSCITKLYKFGVAFGAIALVFFVVLAGYLYIAGGEGSKAKGKSIFTASLTGMAIILSSYLLLGFINPELTKIKPIQAPIFSASNLPKCSDVGYGQNCVLPSGQVFQGGNGTAYGNGKKCTAIASGPLSPDSLKNSCFGRLGGDEVARQASVVANMESNGAMIPVGEGSCGKGKRPARCDGGEIPVWGVYQINIAANDLVLENGQVLDCTAAFQQPRSFTCSGGCAVVNPARYNECKTRAMNMTVQLNTACDIYKKRKKAGQHGFSAWGNSGNFHYQVCNFPNVPLPPGA